jgi:predicted house-cleaning noncanonical NTP pyrophosphatase (MazG superfamily)
VGKLVRDRIPEIIRANAEVPVVRTLTAREYHEALRDKLHEECEEARSATLTELPDELADVLEVLQAMATSADVAWDEVLAVQQAKREERGGFNERLWLEGLA